MNPAPDARNPSLIGGVIVSRPLEGDGLGRALFERQIIVGIRAHATGEIISAGNRGQNLCSRAAEGAVAGEVTRKSRRDEARFLIRNPVVGICPGYTAILQSWTGRWTGPTANGDFADSER